MPFKKGVSGNPGGRKAGVRALAEKAIKKYGLHPFEYLAKLLADNKAASRDRTIAAKELLDRVYGKAPAHVVSETTVEIKDKVTEEVQEVLDKLKGK